MKTALLMVTLAAAVSFAACSKKEETTTTVTPAATTATPSTTTVVTTPPTDAGVGRLGRDVAPARLRRLLTTPLRRRTRPRRLPLTAAIEVRRFA